MFHDLSIIIPYRADGGRRDRLLAFTRARLARILPGAEQLLGDDGGPIFSRGPAINAGATQATRPILLITDNDLVFPASLVARSINALSRHAWVIPFRWYAALTKQATDQLLKQGRVSGLHLSDAPTKYVREGSMGGMTIITRQAFQLLGGFDPRFIGWGCEDTAFACLADTLLGPHLRMPATIYHLWHERARKAAMEAGTWQQNRELYLRYAEANGNRHAMRLLREEARHDG